MCCGECYDIVQVLRADWQDFCWLKHCIGSRLVKFVMTPKSQVWNPSLEEPLFTMHGHSDVIAGLEVVLGSNRVITVDVGAVLKVLHLSSVSFHWFDGVIVINVRILVIENFTALAL